jgi:hypothetical protein
MTAINSQMSQAKGWGFSREKEFESKGVNKEGQKWLKSFCKCPRPWQGWRGGRRAWK